MYGLNDAVIAAIRQLAIRFSIERVVLFGSRARGDYRERSDIDLAVYGAQADLFGMEVDETVPTLLKFDIVDMTSPVQAELLESIQREGVVLYEKV